MHRHHWTRWADMEKVRVFEVADDPLPVDIYERQQRTCERCGRKQIRRIREPRKR